jgi:hypothetical protein
MEILSTGKTSGDCVMCELPRGFYVFSIRFVSAMEASLRLELMKLVDCYPDFD